MPNQEKIDLSEVQKIRHYVMNLFYRNGEGSIRIPSSRELSDKFHLARSTIRIALEEMTAEGYLITKKGIGTFTNPLKAFEGMKTSRIPLIGIKLGRGDQFYYDGSAMQTLSSLFCFLSKNNYNSRLLSIGCKDAESCSQELKYAYVDAVVCYNANSFYVEQASVILPTISIFGKKIKTASTICSNYKPAVNEFVKKLTHKNGKSIIVWNNVTYTEVYNEFKGHKNITIINGNSDFINLKEFERIPDCIVTHHTKLESIINQLNELKIPIERCKVLLFNYANIHLPFWGLVDQREVACSLAMDYLRSILRSPTKINHKILDCKIEPMNL